MIRNPRAVRGRRAIVLLCTALGVAVACGGCRGIIGYEEVALDTDAAAADASREGAVVGQDSGPQSPGDSATVGADTSPIKPQVDQCSGQALPTCMPCCRTLYGPEFDQLKQMAQNQCYCAGHGCDVECGLWCTTPVGPPPQGACGACLDTKLRSCATVLSTCNGQGNCAPAAGCVERCQ